MDNVQQAIGKKIRDARSDFGMTQHNVADAIGMSRSNYQKIERGRVNVTGVLLIKLARLFNVTFDRLLNLEALPNSGEPPFTYLNAMQIEALQNKLTYQEKMLADKEDIIRFQREKLEAHGL